MGGALPSVKVNDTRLPSMMTVVFTCPSWVADSMARLADAGGVLVEVLRCGTKSHPHTATPASRIVPSITIVGAEEFPLYVALYHPCHGNAAEALPTCPRTIDARDQLNAADTGADAGVDGTSIRVAAVGRAVAVSTPVIVAARSSPSSPRWRVMFDAG